jgi:hypothetical protein
MLAIQGRDNRNLIVFNRFVCSSRRRSNEVKVMSAIQWQVNPRPTRRPPRVGGAAI